MTRLRCKADVCRASASYWQFIPLYSTPIGGCFWLVVFSHYDRDVALPSSTSILGFHIPLCPDSLQTKKLRVSVQIDKLLLNLSLAPFFLSQINSQVFLICADLQRLHPHLNTIKKNLHIKIEKKLKANSHKEKRIFKLIILILSSFLPSFIHHQRY